MFLIEVRFELRKVFYLDCAIVEYFCVFIVLEFQVYLFQCSLTKAVFLNIVHIFSCKNPIQIFIHPSVLNYITQVR